MNHRAFDLKTAQRCSSGILAAVSYFTRSYFPFDSPQPLVFFQFKHTFRTTTGVFGAPQYTFNTPHRLLALILTLSAVAPAVGATWIEDTSVGATKDWFGITS
jgi:hypothetical protein